MKCFIFSFLGCSAALFVLSLSIKLQMAYERFITSDYTKEELARKTVTPEKVSVRL